MDEVFFNFFENPPKIGYIPSCSDLDRFYYRKQKEWYDNIGENELFYFDLDKEFDDSKTEELLSCDAIFLSGGDTRYFLNNIRKRGFIEKLRDFTSRGGVLIGASAGSIIMTPNIDITELDHGHNTKKLEDMSALKLVDFEFFPHLDEINIKEAINYSKKKRGIVYACEDGDGIIVNNEEVIFFGKVLKIEGGNITTINE